MRPGLLVQATRCEPVPLGPSRRSPLTTNGIGELSVSKAKRKRQRANRRARAEADQAIPVITDLNLDQLLAEVTVRADCEHASTRATADGLVLTRCAVNADLAGGCPRDCGRFEKRRVGGVGLGLGAGG